ncbi:MAG: serine O-acetyltransferase [Candidatus Thermoplasmatota archaeon]|nr:serine O-acetyltransferase [Candidatus Thermoplasmatota archaeon]
MFKRLREDIKTVFAKDPAAKSAIEIFFLYPGLHAIWSHRVSHFFWKHRLRFLARLVSHVNRFFTGIEIHPGATIGRRVFIDHGMGVVIGETAEVGDDVLMYQGVVLGGVDLEKKKRHPTVESGVVIGAGAILLGPITIGSNARVGAGSVVVKSVPPGKVVVGIPGRIIEEKGKHLAAIEHGVLPDPVAEAIRFILKRQDKIESMLEKRDGVHISGDAAANESSRLSDAFGEGGGI